MNRPFFWASAILLLLPGIPTTRATESAVQQANAWISGQSIAPELLSYRKLSSGPAYTPAPEDSASIIGAITNSQLLVDMLFDSRIDSRVFALAVERSLRLKGPQAFFGEVARRYQEKQEWLLFPLHKRLFTELNQRHCVVDAIFISEADMPVSEAFDTMHRIINDLKAAKSWDAAFEQYSRNLRTEMQLELGPITQSVSVSKLGKFGPVILCERSRPEETFVSDVVPPDHRSALLKGAQGEVFLTHDPPRSRVVLYRVREVYLPRTQ